MKISPEVLDVLAMVECNANRAVIVEQLDRKLYTKTNDVLVALGGKWTKSAKAHVFDGPAQERIDQAILVGEVTTAKDLGFYPTPPALAGKLVDFANVEPGHTCLEPSAGTGSIVRALFRVGGETRVIAFERDEKMRQQLVKFGLISLYNLDVAPNDDFMELAISNIFLEVDRVVMNPPFYKVGFGDHLDHARLAYKLLRIGGIMVCVLPSSVLFRRDKRYAEFRAWVAEIDGTLEDLPEGSFRESGTMVNTCVLRAEKRA